MDIQVSFHLGFTGLMSLLSKGPSSIFTSTRVRKHQFFDAHSAFFMVQLSQPSIQSQNNYYLALYMKYMDPWDREVQVSSVAVYKGNGDFPGGPVAKTHLYSQCKGSGLDPWSEN